jgi:hypothetical protein
LLLVKLFPAHSTFSFLLSGENVTFFQANSYEFLLSQAGNKYRTDAVDIWYMSAVEVGYYVGATNTREWLDYSLDVEAAGQYSIDFWVATPNSGGRLHVEIDGVNVSGAITLPNTGS